MIDKQKKCAKLIAASLELFQFYRRYSMYNTKKALAILLFASISCSVTPMKRTHEDDGNDGTPESKRPRRSERLELNKNIAKLVAQHENANEALVCAVKEDLTEAIIPLVKKHGANADHLTHKNNRASQVWTRIHTAAAIYVPEEWIKEPNYFGGPSDLEGTALMNAAYLGRNIMVQTLIDAGANVNYTENSKTTLILAAQEGHDTVVQTLIDAGADVNAKTNDGYSALHFAANSKIAQMLCKAGAKPQKKPKTQKPNTTFEMIPLSDIERQMDPRILFKLMLQKNKK
jgi:hypothetical protein